MFLSVVDACIRACVHACVNVCVVVRMAVRSCMRTCALSFCMCGCSHVRAIVYAYMCTFVLCSGQCVSEQLPRCMPFHGSTVIQSFRCTTTSSGTSVPARITGGLESSIFARRVQRKCLSTEGKYSAAAFECGRHLSVRSTRVPFSRMLVASHTLISSDPLCYNLTIYLRQRNMFSPIDACL